MKSLFGNIACWRFATAAAFAVSIVSMSASSIADDLPGSVAAEPETDPLEGLNRVTSDFNRAVRQGLVDPLVDGYQYITPDPVERGISNVFSNLTEPVTAVSSLLQGDADNAGNATARFIVNSTLGLAGTSDRARDMGIEQRREDFGQAMGAHGVGSGPHIVLPILGPSNLRDATGDILTGLASPLPLAVHAAGTSVTYADHQDDFNALNRNSVDPYVAEREAYEQHRVYAIGNGDAFGDTDFPTFAEPASGTDVATSAK